jgi:hypothetical protein
MVESGAVTVDDNRSSAAEPDLAGRVGTFIIGKPKVEGEVVEVMAARNAKPSHVGAAIQALKKGKAKGALVKTETRDKTTVDLLPLTFVDAFPPCSAAAYVAKDAAVHVWTAGGTVATRFTRGWAGPDITLGSDAIRKASTACDSNVFFVGGDEAMTWGVVFDLAVTARGAVDGGAPTLRAKDAVLANDMVPGRKVTAE